MRRARPLRSGYTTGACASAASKAATLLLFGTLSGDTVDIPMPSGERAIFSIHSRATDGLTARASIIKDAGDDPDVTNHAEIVAHATRSQSGRITVQGGNGIGVVTRPGLPVAIGQPAINPVPMRMIRSAVDEALPDGMSVTITISVPLGEELAAKTLNARLGIIGGISILGTTGIVRPLSTEAWTATITASMDVAQAIGVEDIVLSSGRTSELAHMRAFNLPEAAYVMMGDYVQWSLKEAQRHNFKTIHLSAQWAKMLKIAMATPDTHVRAGAIDLDKARGLLAGLGIRLPKAQYNTAREMLEDIKEPELIGRVIGKAREYCESISGRPVRVYLVSYEGALINA